MKQTTSITLPSNVERALEEHRRDRGKGSELTILTEAAFREFMAGRGDHASAPPRVLHSTPAKHSRGPTDVSVNHDRYLAEGG